MIDRYARPAMKMVWSEENKNNKWLQVELAVCEAWTEEGVIPPRTWSSCEMRSTTRSVYRRCSNALATI